METRKPIGHTYTRDELIELRQESAFGEETEALATQLLTVMAERDAAKAEFLGSRVHLEQLAVHAANLAQICVSVLTIAREREYRAVIDSIKVRARDCPTARAVLAQAKARG